MTIKNKRKKQEKLRYNPFFGTTLSEEWIQFKKEQEMKLWYGEYQLQRGEINLAGIIEQIHNDRIR